MSTPQLVLPMFGPPMDDFARGKCDQRRAFIAGSRAFRLVLADMRRVYDGRDRRPKNTYTDGVLRDWWQRGMDSSMARWFRR